MGDTGMSRPDSEGPALLFRLVPAFDSLRKYSLRAFGSDLLAGLTVATVAVPQGMAYAIIAGLPPHYGLYTAIVMTAVGALFDSSRQLINGPTNAISIAVLSALAPVADADRVAAAVLLALLVGLIQTGITLFRLGDLTRFISHAVIVGFTLGAGTLLVLDQLKNLLGLASRGGAEDHFLVRFGLTLWHGEINPATAALGLGTIALVLLLRGLNWFLPLRRWVPIPIPDFLITIVVMAVVVWLFDLEAQGVKIVQDIPAALPAFQVPQVEWVLVQQLSGSALAIALLGLLEAIAMAKAIAAQTRQKLDMNQQCLSEGLANITGSFFQCFPGSGSLTRSAINQATGAVTQWSGVFSAIAVAATVLLFAPFAYYIPYASLAGILMISACNMIDRRQLIYHLRATSSDAGIVIVTALSAIVISVEFCIFIGVILSFVLYVPRAARVHMAELIVTPERVIREKIPGDTPCSRILIFNLEGELFFGSAPELDRHLSTIERRVDDGCRVVVLRLKRARNPDGVCIHLLEQFMERLEGRSVTVLLCGVRRDLNKGLRNTGTLARLGPRRVFRETAGQWSSTLEAVRHAYTLLDGDYCTVCPRRTEPEGQTWYYMI
jgi:SulP family sulfate permease